MFSTENKLTVQLCNQYSNRIFVFGDNLIKKGKAGQAQIRDCPNSFGIPTKRFPSMQPQAFFSDREDEIVAVKEKILELWGLHKQGKHIVLPTVPFGSGLAKLPEKSPKIWSMINIFYMNVLNKNKGEKNVVQNKTVV